MKGFTWLIGIVVSCVVVAGCGDDGGGLNDVDAADVGIDASQTGIDATPGERDANRGDPCSFPELLVISDSDVGRANLCYEPPFGDPCFIMELGPPVCPIQSVGFSFAIDNQANARSVELIDQTFVFTSAGTQNGNFIEAIPNGTNVSISAMSGPTEFTVDFRFDDNDLTISSLSSF
jgi:hypothetical protein